MKKYLILSSLVAALGGLLFGFDTAVVNGALQFFREYLQLEPDSFMEGWVVSSVLQTVIIGTTNLLFTILAMAVIDRLGRKKMLLSGALLMTLFLALFSFFFISEVEGSSVVFSGYWVLGSYHAETAE